MTIRITYVQDGRSKRATIDGSTTQDAVRWMAQYVPNVHVFRATVMRNRQQGRSDHLRLGNGLMMERLGAADETGTGAHRPVRR